MCVSPYHANVVQLCTAVPTVCNWTRQITEHTASGITSRISLQEDDEQAVVKSQKPYFSSVHHVMLCSFLQAVLGLCSWTLGVLYFAVQQYGTVACTYMCIGND